MPIENEGSRLIEASQRKAFNVPTQDEINNERMLAKREEMEKGKREGDAQQKEWIEQEKEHKRKLDETFNQRKFFLDLQQKLKDGRISPDLTIPFEETEERSAEDIANMDDHTFSLWVERGQFGRELYDIRMGQEKREIANALADNIEKDRKKSWEKRTELMTPEERASFNRKFAEELDKLEQK
jgi:hypothetical protein